MPGKRSVSSSTESITAVGPGDEVGQGAPVEGGSIGKAGPVVEFAPMAERLIEPLSGDAKIESLKSKLLHRTTPETPPDPSEDVVAVAEVMWRNIYRKFLKDELCEIIKILDKMTDKDEVRKIYRALDRAIHNAVVLGMHTVGFIELRQQMEESARRAKRTENVAARKRREKMRPFVEEFVQVNGFWGPATTYKALMKRGEFVSVIDEADRQSRSIDKHKARIPKGLNPRQIKGDIEAILVAIDTEAELAEREGRSLDESETT
jgi:hypothetical protein